MYYYLVTFEIYKMFKTKDNLKKLSKKYKGILSTAYAFSNIIIDDLNPPKLAKDVFELIALRNNQQERL